MKTYMLFSAIFIFLILQTLTVSFAIDEIEPSLESGNSIKRRFKQEQNFQFETSFFIQDTKENHFKFLDSNNRLRKFYKSNSNKKLTYSHTECITKEGERVRYLKYLSLPFKVNFVINRTAVSGNKFSFHINKSCSKLIPTMFISTKNQTWMGMHLARGEGVAVLPKNDEKNISFIYEDNLYPRMSVAKLSHTIYKKLSRLRYNNLNAEEGVYIKILKEGDEFYAPAAKVFYNYRFFTSDEIEDNNTTLFGLTPYLGNKLCLKDNKVKLVFGLSSHDLDPIYLNSEDEYDHKTGELFRKIFFQGDSEDIQNGKRCNKIIAEYEKKTGKKVSYSPLLTKPQIEFILKNHFHREVQ